MIMIVVGPATVAAVFIEFADQVGVFAPVIERIEDRHSVDSQRDGAAKKAVFRHRRLFRGHWLDWNPPSVFALVRLWQRHLLLPSTNADHHRMIGKAFRFHIEVCVIASD